ncbi:histidine phosphatase family protein [Belliella sp. DSM 111904]|uniref:Histidine phosphatase family protein n=1 Tax=Belliella filtrata TaxID=2923435 RepID=A0ABS9UYI6_9BACT|nr:histidine phosphatase family protein [Belliella filtrata]MCH7409214.1 histidine phosphatase family protein [Belliella filtrata]
MKKLIIVRHAKSSWDNPFLDDHKRPLSERGLRDAPRMAQRLKKKGIIPEYMLVSDAVRTKETARIFAQNLGVSDELIHYKRELYHASQYELIRSIRHVSDDVENLYLVGHNPGMNDLLSYFGFRLNNLPTCGVVIFKIGSKSWTSISPAEIEFLAYDFPKNEML